MIENKIQKETLRNIPLFSELSVEQLREVTSVSKTIKVPKNKILFWEGDLYKGFYILLKGGIKIFKTTVRWERICCSYFNYFKCLCRHSII